MRATVRTIPPCVPPGKQRKSRKEERDTREEYLMSRPRDTTHSPKCTVAILGPRRSQGQNNIWPPKDPMALSRPGWLSHFFRFLSDWPHDAIDRKKRLESEVVLEDQRLSGMNGMGGGSKWQFTD